MNKNTVAKNAIASLNQTGRGFTCNLIEREGNSEFRDSYEKFWYGLSSGVNFGAWLDRALVAFGSPSKFAPIPNFRCKMIRAWQRNDKKARDNLIAMVKQGKKLD